MARPKPTGDNVLHTATIQLPIGTLNKLSYVAWFDRRPSKKAVIEDALEALLSKWEKKNGPITPEHIAEMEKALRK